MSFLKGIRQMSSLFMLVAYIRLRKSDSVGHGRICLRSEMQTQEFLQIVSARKNFTKDWTTKYSPFQWSTYSLALLQLLEILSS